MGSAPHRGAGPTRASIQRPAHDLLGRRTRRTIPSGIVSTWTYDDAGRPQTLGLGGHRTEFGRKVPRTAGPGMTLAQEWDGTGRLTGQTVLDPAGTGAQAGTDARFHAIVTDMTGRPTELVSPDGELAWHQRTTTWGVPVTDPDGDTVDCPLRFPGQYADPETGWYFNYFRHYDPLRLPRPTRPRPAPNAQTYVANPFAWIDPLGPASKYKTLPGWKDGEPIDTKWHGRVTYSPLDGQNRPGPVTAEIHKDMLGQNTGPKIARKTSWPSTSSRSRRSCGATRTRWRPRSAAAMR